jgi:hypothetical protein
MIGHSVREDPTLQMVGEIKAIDTQMGLSRLPSSAISLDRSEGGNRRNCRVNRLISSTAVGPRQFRLHFHGPRQDQLFPRREQRQAPQEHGDDERRTRSQAVPQLTADPGERKGEQAEAGRRQTVGDATHLLGNAPGDQRAERRLEHGPTDAQQGPRQGEAGEAGRYQENRHGKELGGYPEHDAQPFAGLIDQPPRRVAGCNPGDAENAVQQTDVALGQSADVGQVDRHQLEGDLQSAVAHGVGDQDPGDQPARERHQDHYAQRSVERGQIGLPLPRFLQGSADTDQDEKRDRRQRSGERGGEEHPAVAVGLTEKSTERWSEDPGQFSGGLGEAEGATPHLLRGLVGDVRVIRGDPQRGGDGGGRRSHQGDLPARCEDEDHVRQHAEHAADLQRTQPADTIGNPSAEDTQQKREDQRDGEEGPDLTDVRAQLAQEDRHLDGGHAVRGLDEEHRHQEDQEMSCDDGFLGCLRHVGVPYGQRDWFVKCASETIASVSRSEMSDARHCATRGPRGQLKGGALCGRNSSKKRYSR